MAASDVPSTLRGVNVKCSMSINCFQEVTTYLNLHPKMLRRSTRQDTQPESLDVLYNPEARGRMEGGVTLVGYNSIFSSI